MLPRTPFRRLRSRILAGFTLILLCVAVSTASAESSTADNIQAERRAIAAPNLAAFDGDWSRVESVDRDLGRLESIDSAIEDLSWIIRRMASGVLKKSTSPPHDLAFSWDGNALHQLVEGTNGRSRRPVRLGGEPQLLTDHRGEDFTSQWRWTDRGLEVHWTQSQAYGSNVYRLGENGSLAVEHRIQVTALEGIDAIVYESRFRRIDPPAVSASVPTTQTTQTMQTTQPKQTTAVAGDASELR